MQKDGVKLTSAAFSVLLSLANVSIGTSLHIGTVGHMLSNRSLASAKPSLWPFTTASLLHYTQFLLLYEDDVW